VNAKYLVSGDVRGAQSNQGAQNPWGAEETRLTERRLNGTCRHRGYL